MPLTQEELKAVHEQAAAEAREKFAATLKALNEAFADAPAFAAQCAAEGLSVEQAKARRHDALSAQVATLTSERDTARTELGKLQAENADLKKQLGALGAPPAGDGSNAQPPTKFMSRVRAHHREQKCSFREALSAVRASDPEAFKQAEAAGEL